jgi:beta-lactamase regulating signal transducer with metallopeptidase domain
LLIATAIRSVDPRLEPIFKSLNLGTVDIEVRESSKAPCPMLIGIRRPIIISPTGSLQQLTDSELKMTIIHEITHFRRRDILLSNVPALVHLLYFFNPLALMAINETAAACEEACDNEVIRLMAGSPATYARFLLKWIHPQGTTKDWNAALGTVFKPNSLKRRISMLTYSNTRPFVRSIQWTTLGLVATITVVPWSVSAQANHISGSALRQTKKIGTCILNSGPLATTRLGNKASYRRHQSHLFP